jgi:hypothetical protein
MRVLKQKDIVDLLRSEVQKAGSQEAWAKKAVLPRTLVNKVLHGKRPPSKSIILALGLRVVVVKD